MENSQVEIISKALDLSLKVRDKSSTLAMLQSQAFKSVPTEPVRKYIQKKEYPPIKP